MLLAERTNVSWTGLVFNRQSNTYDTVATITNLAAEPLGAPLSIVVTNISPAASSSETPPECGLMENPM